MATHINTISTYEVECDECSSPSLRTFEDPGEAQGFANRHRDWHIARRYMAHSLAEKCQDITDDTTITGKYFGQPGEWLGKACARAEAEEFSYFVFNDWVRPVSDATLVLCTWDELEAARARVHKEKS